MKTLFSLFKNHSRPSSSNKKQDIVSIQNDNEISACSTREDNMSSINKLNKPVEVDLIHTEAEIIINEDHTEQVGRPDIYNSQEWQEKKNKYTWLICLNGYIGCSECKKAKSLSVEKMQGTNLLTRSIKFNIL